MPRFEKGRSGNPSGRKKNSLDKRSAWRCELGGQVVQSRNGALAMADVTAVLPVAVLSPQR